MKENKLSFLKFNYISLIFIITFLITEAKTYTQWIHQNSGTNAWLTSVNFVNQNTGWAVGADSLNGIILNTINGGISWNLNTSQYYFNNVKFIDQNTGWIIGSTGGFPNFGVVQKTTNGGINWQNQSYLTYTYLISSYFLNQNTGWIVGCHNVDYRTLILKTTNGGINWFSQDSGLSFENTLTSIQFIDQFTGWAVGGDLHMSDTSAIILKTSDGGLHWKLQISKSESSLNSVFFIDQNTGLAVGFNRNDHKSLALKTTNSGVNWINLDSCSFNNLALVSMCFTDPSTIYSVGYYGIIKSIHGGDNWFYQDPLNLDQPLSSVFFIDQHTGWAVGYNGIILKTTNGGDPTGIQPKGRNFLTQYLLYQNYPNPFNPSTNINFSLPKKTFVELTIYNSIGQIVERLVNAELDAGSYKVDWNAAHYSSGVYFYRIAIHSDKLKAGDFGETRKMVLIK